MMPLMTSSSLLGGEITLALSTSFPGFLMYLEPTMPSTCMFCWTRDILHAASSASSITLTWTMDSAPYSFATPFMRSAAMEYMSRSSVGVRSYVPEYHPSFAFSKANPVFCSASGALTLFSSESTMSIISSMFCRSTEDVSIILHPGRILSTSVRILDIVSLSTRSVFERMTISASRIWCSGMMSTVSTFLVLSLDSMPSALTQSTTTISGATLNSSGYSDLMGATTELMMLVDEPIGSAIMTSGFPSRTRVLALDTNLSKLVQKQPPMISLVSNPASLEYSVSTRTSPWSLVMMATDLSYLLFMVFAMLTASVVFPAPR